MSANDFSAALQGLGICCDVEEHGRLAVIMFRPPARDPSLALSMTNNQRRTIVALGRTHGFANVCVELHPDATLSGD